MTYKVLFTATARKMLAGISDRRVRAQITHRIEGLSEDPENQGKPLGSELVGYRSIRVSGRYRVIYQVDRGEVRVLVIAVGIRRDGRCRCLPASHATCQVRPHRTIGELNQMTTSDAEYGTEQISIAKARAMLSQLPELLSNDNQAMAVTRHGKPVMAMMSWDLFESIMETMDIMGDPDLMAALRQSVEDVRAGRFIPLEQVKSELLS